jgi:hypothetical protein
MYKYHRKYEFLKRGDGTKDKYYTSELLHRKVFVCHKTYHHPIMYDNRRNVGSILYMLR